MAQLFIWGHPAWRAKFCALAALLGTFVPALRAQTIQDTVLFPTFTVSAYFTDQPLLREPASASVIDSAQIALQTGQSLVPALNTVAGVRMEERSPGSYRLSIRGSLLRSPFGVRNVKVYLEEFPLTDAGGNTYINLIDVNLVDRIEVLKGPDGLFGANSGGVVKIGLTNDRAPLLSGDVAGGSYGYQREHVQLQKQFGKHIVSIGEAAQHNDGYRQNSSFDRTYVQATEKWNYAPQAQLKLFGFFSDLAYRTPGGLTLAQYNSDPRIARPSGAGFPGAEEQKAGVHDRTIYGGVANAIGIGKYFRHVLAVFGSHTDFENPFITNYEVRKENTDGMRTWIEAGNQPGKNFHWNAYLGLEGQQTSSEISNYGNRKGERDTLQVADHLRAIQNFIFTRFTADLHHRWLFEGSVSLNYFGYIYENVYPQAISPVRRNFAPQLLPHISFSHQLSEYVAWRAIVAKGYSPPTLAEIRSSSNMINTQLQPESGWNFETGFRLQDPKGRYWYDVTLFYYRLQEAIVRRVNPAGDEYFVNAGGTIQPGVESQLFLWFLRDGHGFFHDVSISNSWTFSPFMFNDYRVGYSDYSGNWLTGVPRHVVVTSVGVRLPEGFSVFVQHNFTARLPLNDANTAYADNYHLVQIKADWRFVKTPLQVDLFAGVDNLLNEKYSLGNDLNAAGGRYYNPAPGINYFAGLTMRFK